MKENSGDNIRNFRAPKIPSPKKKNNKILEKNIDNNNTNQRSNEMHLSSSKASGSPASVKLSRFHFLEVEYQQKIKIECENIIE